MNVNDLYLADNDFEQKLNMLKTKLRVRMNGEISAQMERRQSNYAINYGASLPHVRELSASLKFTADECRRLWLMDIRETMLIAAMQFPVETADTDEMLHWAQRIKTSDMAEQSAFFLFSRLPDLEQFAIKLMNEKSKFSYATACFSVARAMQSGRAVELNAVKELAYYILSISKVSGTEARAVSFLLRQVVRQGIDEVDVKSLLNSILEKDTNEAKQIAFEVQTEIEMLSSEKKLGHL